MKTKLQGVRFDSTENIIKDIEKRSKTGQDNKNEIRSWKGSERTWYIEDRQRRSNTQTIEKQKADQWSKTNLKLQPKNAF